jgi:hypothetical protein
MSRMWSGGPFCPKTRVRAIEFVDQEDMDMYACSTNCCVGQAGRKGLVNLFWTLGWQGTCRQGKVPAQSYVSTNCLSFWSTGRIRILETWRGRRGESRGMGRGMGMGQGPEPGLRPGTGYWVPGTGGLGTGHGTGVLGSRKKVGSRLGCSGCERGRGCWSWSWRLALAGEGQTRVELTIERRLSTLVAQPGHNMMMCSLVCV